MSEENVHAFNVRWPADLVADIDELAAADDRNRNNWLLVQIRPIVEREKTIRAGAQARGAT